MHYYLYEIRNNINDKIYIGVHKTKSLEDGYMGSGLIINKSIAKHGIENFTKTILEYFETSEEMYAREKEIVDDEFLIREDVYNLRRGGFGGFDYINSTPEKYREFRSQGGKNMPEELRKQNGHKTGQQQRKRWEEDPTTRPPLMFTKEFNSLMSERARSANKNTCFINNGVLCKRLKKDLQIPDGWVKGRLVKQK
jgi:hypothetical protein